MPDAKAPETKELPKEDLDQEYSFSEENLREADKPLDEARTDEVKEEAPKPIEPVVHRHSKRLRMEALELGFSPEEIDSTPSDQLDDRVWELQQRAQRIAREQQARAAAVRKPEPEVKPATDDEGDMPDFEGWDESASKVLKQIIAENRKAAKKSQEQIDQLRKELAEERTEAVVQRLDKAFARFPEVFGVGNASKLAPDSAELARRNLIVAQLARSNDKNIDIEGEIEKAVKLFGISKPEARAEAKAPEKTAEETQLDERRKEFRAGRLPAPDGRKEEELPPGRERAERNARKRIQARETAAPISAASQRSWEDDFFGPDR